MDDCKYTGCPNYIDCHSDTPNVTKGCVPVIAKPKEYYLMMNVGSSKYSVNFYNGIDTHKDGSHFYGIRLFKNKKKMNTFIKELRKKGYNER